MKTYLFYDLETSGLNKAFDQVLRFASIRTDLRFRELDRQTVSVRLRPDVIYSPEAMLVNRISISDAKTGICEYEASRTIHSLLNEPGTTSVGYNNLGFDDELLRFTFHRNLLPPYTHQYDKGCNRMDLLPIVVIFYLYRREVLTWPRDMDQPTIKLEHLSDVNRLASGPAHDAMVDVEATVELARRLSREEEVWNYLTGCFNKDIDRSRMEALPSAFSTLADFQLALLADSVYGFQHQFQIPAIYIGNSIPYANQTLWLRLDQPELQDTAADRIMDTTWVVRKKLGEPEIVLPPLERYLKVLNTERRRAYEENLKWLAENPSIFEDIIRYHTEYTYPPVPDLDSDAALYEMGFLTRKEQDICRRFHDLSLEEKPSAADRFTRPILKILAQRIITRNYPQYAGRSAAKEMKQYMGRVNPKEEAKAMLDYTGAKRRTPADALAAISDMAQDAALDTEQRDLLDGLRTHIQGTFFDG